MMTIFRDSMFKKSVFQHKLVEPAVLFLVLFFPGYMGTADAVSAIDFGSVRFLLTYFIIALPQIALILIIIRKKGLNAFSDYNIVPFKRKNIARAFLLFLLVFFISGFLLWLVYLSGLGKDSPLVSWALGNPALFPLAIAASFVTGYREELFFRAYLLRELSEFRRERSGTDRGISWREISASSLLFTFGHLYQGFSRALIIFVVSQLFGLHFSRHRNFHEVAIAHGLYNSAVLLLVMSGTG
jgi:uncharacterized protein